MDFNYTKNNVGQEAILKCKSGYIPSRQDREIVCQYDDIRGSFWRYKDESNVKAECIEGMYGETCTLPAVALLNMHIWLNNDL